MDTGSFVSSLRAHTGSMPMPPGNAQAGTTVPNFLNPEKDEPVGQYQPGWKSWLVNIKDKYIAPTLAFTVSPVQAITKSTKETVKKSVDSALEIATGIGGAFKWIVVGLVAFAAIYLLSFLSGLLPRRAR